MKIGDNFWVNGYADYNVLKELHENGARLASTLEFSHEVKDGDDTYYCFRPTDKRVDGCLYLTAYFIDKVLDMLEATVDYNMEDGNVLTFIPTGMIINHGKQIKFKRDSEYVYKLQKTQYKGESAYGLLGNIVDRFWTITTTDRVRRAGYLK